MIALNIKQLLEVIFLYIRSNFFEHTSNYDQIFEEYTNFQKSVLEVIEELTSTYKRRKFIFENVPKPKEITLGSRFDLVFDKKQQIYIEIPKRDTFMYISLLDTLETICSKSYNQKHITSKETNFSEILTDIADGEYIRQCEFHNDQITLKIQLYIDEFEPVNGMGYKTGVHKTTAIYFIVRNLPNYMNSKLKNIHLLSLMYSQDVKKYGINLVLENMIRELKILETTGIRVNFLKTQKYLKGSLVAISADNLGSNSLCGFVESFSATYFCRICLVNHSDLQTVFNERQVTLRTKENYALHLSEQLQKNLSNEESNNTYGVKDSCCLNELQYFHMIDGPTVDIMHDLLEGVVQWELSFFFEYIIKNKILSQDNVNQKIAAFNYGVLERSNIPNSVLFGRETVGQKAAQCWCLIRFTPLIFIDIFEQTENTELKKICNLINKLISILSYSFAPKISITMTYELEELIEFHHKLLKELFPNKRLKPKHHYMIHYPRVMRKMGPLILLWCMRFEGKHLQFKKLSQCIQNFVNCCKTFSFRHQEYMCYINMNEDDELSITYQVFSINSVNDFSYYNDILQQNLNTNSVLFVKSCTYIDKFKKGLFVCTGVDNNNIPIFYEIKEVFIFKSKGYLILQNWVDIYFDIRFNAFVIKEPKQNILCIKEIGALYLLSTFEKLYINEKWFIIPKHKII